MGGNLINLDQIQVHPLGDPIDDCGCVSEFVGNWLSATEYMFVNKEGKRFINEDNTRYAISMAELQQTDGQMWLIVDSSAIAGDDSRNELIDKLLNDGHSVKADTLDELAEKIGVDADILKATVEAYNAGMTSGKDEFGKATSEDSTILQAPFYASLRTPTVHYTMGGIQIDTDAHVLNAEGNIVPGLYAAGEVTSGIHGNNRLGGDDFDECITKYLVDEFRKSDGIDLSGDKVAMQRLREAAEKAKIELSGVTTSNINLPYITADATGPKHLDVTLTRAKFNELTHHLVEKTMGPVKQALSDSGLNASDISKVLMVGGSSRIPAVQEMVKKLTGKEGFKGINPDECVAMGAALQAGVLTGDVKGLLLLDVTPLSLGIETMGGVCTKLIDRNTTIPVKKSQIFSTAADNQTSVEVNVLQGEREMAAANKSLGRFHLDGIAPARRGVPQIEVTFDIDANGIVNVSAKDLGTGTEQHITITSSSNMSKEDIEKAVKDAEQYAAEDAKLKEKVEVRNQADQMVYQSEKTLGEVGDKIPADEKSKVQAGIDKLKETLKGSDTAAIKAATEALTQVFYKLSEKMYQQANPQGQPGANPGCDPNCQGGDCGNGGDNGQQYYDADYTVVDDDKK